MLRLPKWPWLVRYGLATVFVVFAIAAGQWLKGPPFVLLFPSVIIIAVLLDHGCGIYATLLAAGLASYRVVSTSHPTTIDPHNFIALLVFVITGLGITYIVEAMREAIDRLSGANRALVITSAERDQTIGMLNAVLEGTPDPVYVKDRGGCFVHVNQAAATLLGADIPSVIGRRDRDFLPADVAEQIEAVDAEVLAASAPLLREEIVGVEGAERRHFLSSKFRWTSGKGEVLGLIGISRDITDRKVAEDKLRAADAQKQLLLFDVNHRVKNHLQTVVGLISVASRRVTSVDSGREALHEAASRLTVLARVYTRLQMGAEAAVVDAGPFLRELCEDLAEGLVGSRPIDIAVDADDSPIDSHRAVTVGLIINELVQNALKYAFPAGRAGTITIDLRRAPHAFRLSVADDGEGYVVGAGPVGSGSRLIGAMVQQLDGTVHVDAAPGQGTRTTIDFPTTLVTEPGF